MGIPMIRLGNGATTEEITPILGGTVLMNTLSRTSQIPASAFIIDAYWRDAY